MGRRRLVGQRRRTIKDARPVLKGKKRARRSRARKGETSLTGLDKAGERVVESATDALAGSYNDVMVPIYRWAHLDWPVKTGFSKSALSLYVKRVRGFVVMTLRNRASYANYIRQRTRRPIRTSRRLVFNPGRKSTKKLVNRMRDHLSKEF